MEFLRKPVSDAWKSTKQTFSEIMELNDTVIGSGKRRGGQPRPCEAEGVGGEDGKPTDPVSSSDVNGLSSHISKTEEKVDARVSTSTSKSLGEKSQHDGHPKAKHSISIAKTDMAKKRVVSGDVRQKEDHDVSTASLSVNCSVAAQSQQKETNPRYSLNSHFGKIWKDLRTLNMMNTGGNKSDATTSKKSQLKPKSRPVSSRGPETLSPNSAQYESDTSSRTHRAHSHSRSRQGSLSESQHFRSNSTDRASVMKYRESLDNGRPFLRSASDDSMLTDQAGQLDEDEDVDDDISAEKMKTKILSMWNNVRYGWTVKTRTAFSLQKPIWVLGKIFQNRPEDIEEQPPGLDAVKSPAVELFKREFSSRIWLTYRREFPQLPGSSYTTDCGWGCMLRSGQMMLAQAMVQHFLGRDWNYYNEQTEEEQRYHHEIVRWFGDQPDDMSPFSLHRLVEIGKGSGKKAGDWYGPASVAHIFKEAMDQAMDLNPLLEQICVYVAQDCTIYKEDVINLCRRKRPGSLQPVYSDHGSSPSTPVSSPTTPAWNSAGSSSGTSTEPSLPEAKTVVVTAASVHEADVHKTAYRHAENSHPHQVDSPTTTTVTSEQNQSQNVANRPPCPDAGITQAAGTSTESDATEPKKSSVECCPTVSAEPKSEQRAQLNGSSPADSKQHHQPSASQRTDETQQGVCDEEPLQAGQSQSTREGGASSRRDGSTWCASVILVPVRLGGDDINPIYISSVQSLFTLDSCIGIIGGKPKHSLYYVGFQEEKLIHLDPHYCQPVVDMRFREFPLTSFHCMSPRKMAISKMDPSCTVGFYLRTEEDFHQFCERIPKIVQSPSSGQSSTDYPMFILRDGSCQDWNGHCAEKADKPERYLRVRHVNQNGQLIAPVRETEDFVFLES